MPKWLWVLEHLNEKLWFRATLFCVVGVFTALFAPLVKDYTPEHYARSIGAEAVDSILQIIASSMLIVTVFSLNTMVTAYASLASMGDETCKEMAKQHSALILKRALFALTLQEDKELIKSYALV